MTAVKGISLVEALDAIYATRLVPSAEKRRLAARAIALAMRLEAGTPSEATCGEPISGFEAALEQVKASAGLSQKPSVTQAKDILRVNGGHSLASRLAKASKVRNGCAHPDTMLIGDIAECFEQVPKKEAAQEVVEK